MNMAKAFMKSPRQIASAERQDAVVQKVMEREEKGDEDDTTLKDCNPPALSEVRAGHGSIGVYTVNKLVDVKSGEKSTAMPFLCSLFTHAFHCDLSSCLSRCLLLRPVCSLDNMQTRVGDRILAACIAAGVPPLLQKKAKGSRDNAVRRTFHAFHCSLSPRCLTKSLSLRYAGRSDALQRPRVASDVRQPVFRLPLLLGVPDAGRRRGGAGRALWSRAAGAQGAEVSSACLLCCTAAHPIFAPLHSGLRHGADIVSLGYASSATYTTSPGRGQRTAPSSATRARR